MSGYVIVPRELLEDSALAFENEGLDGFARDLRDILAKDAVNDGSHEPEVMAFLHSGDGYMCDRWVDLRRDNSSNPRELILRDHHRAYVADLKKEFSK